MNKPVPYLFQVAMYITLIVVVGSIGLFLYLYLTPEKPPNFFPLNNDDGTYVIFPCTITSGELQTYCLRYTGEDVFVEGPRRDGYFTIPVSAPDINLTQYVNASIDSVEGEFVVARELCYPSGCTGLDTGTHVALVLTKVNSSTSRDEADSTPQR